MEVLKLKFTALMEELVEAVKAHHSGNLLNWPERQWEISGQNYRYERR